MGAREQGGQRLQASHKWRKAQRRKLSILLEELIELKLERWWKPSREGVAAQRQTSARTTTFPTPTLTPTLNPVSAVEEEAAPASHAHKIKHVRRVRGGVKHHGA